jgi:NAD+ diphosphatase
MAVVNFYVAEGFDRAAHRRKDEAWLDARRTDPASLIVPVWRARNLVALAEPPTALFPDMTLVARFGDDPLIFLGETAEHPYFAWDLSVLDEAEAQELARAYAPNAEFVDLRRVGALLPRRDGAVLAYARGVTHWHSRHRFCGVCGAASVAAMAGHTRVCTNRDCATIHFPRTDPATIMLVTDGDRCLLGRQKIWIPGMYSTLAGFVEPGESLEQAVAREVKEETGVEVADVRYHSSQPWPFPASLMLGFYATARTRDLVIDPEELDDGRWFSAKEIRAFPATGGFSLPRPDSIARRLIEGWLAEIG